MDEFELKRVICDYIKEICHYSQMQVFATSFYQKNYFQFQIDEATKGLINFIQEYNTGPMADQIYMQQLPNRQKLRSRQEKSDQNQIQQQEQQQLEQQEQLELEKLLQEEQQELLQQEQQGLGLKTVPLKNLRITKEQLAYYDGSDGRPAYVAMNGIIYDMTNSIQWAGGTHFGQYSGNDLSDVFMGCHNGIMEILANIPQVGLLVT